MCSQEIEERNIEDCVIHKGGVCNDPYDENIIPPTLLRM